MRLLFWVRIPTLLALWWRCLHSRGTDLFALESRSVVIFRLDALGDLVLTTPLFRELKHSFPHARMTVIAQVAYKSVLVTNPYVDEVLCVEPYGGKWLPRPAANLLGALRLYRHKLRRRSFDLAISPRWDTDEHLATMLCALIAARRRVGYSERVSSGKRRYNHGFDRIFDICPDPGPLRHEVLRNLAVVEALGGKVFDDRLEIHLTERDRQHASRELQEVPGGSTLIALGIGAQSPGRRWPLERYAACMAGLSHVFAVQPVITCAPGEHRDAERLAALLPGDPIISDSADIRETCALLERCDLFIGNDTGAAHLAAAMNCPTLVISRHPKAGDPNHPNSPARFAPYCATARVLQPERGLEGCVSRCLRAEPHCIRQITVAEVVAVARDMLMAQRDSRVAPAEAAR